jgi:LysM repeat protein
MLPLRGIGCFAVLSVLMFCTGGCFQAENHLDEEKDPHFQRGRNLASGQDFKDAALEFEKALENNPRSAAAHFELGWLYDTKLTNYAAAIYHYERHVELQPDSERAALVKERIRGCKQELANSEFPLPHSQDFQREVDRLNAENTQLKQQLEAFKNKIASGAAVAPIPVAPVRYAETPAPVRPEPVRQTQPSTPAHSHMHIVQAHETITSIAAQHGVKPSAVLAANPGTDPRHLRIGQSLNLP